MSASIRRKAERAATRYWKSLTPEERRMLSAKLLQEAGMAAPVVQLPFRRAGSKIVRS